MQIVIAMNFKVNNSIKGDFHDFSQLLVQSNLTMYHP